MENWNQGKYFHLLFDISLLLALEGGIPYQNAVDAEKSYSNKDYADVKRFNYSKLNMNSDSIEQDIITNPKPN